MKLKVNSAQWQAFAAAVEARLMYASMTAKTGLVECPRVRSGDTPEAAVVAGVAAFLRWLAQSEDRQHEEPPAAKAGGWDGHWGPGRSRRRAPKRGIVVGNEPGKTQRTKA
jgi:hypothetical protein